MISFFVACRSFFSCLSFSLASLSRTCELFSSSTFVNAFAVVADDSIVVGDVAEAADAADVAIVLLVLVLVAVCGGGVISVCVIPGDTGADGIRGATDVTVGSLDDVEIIIGGIGDGTVIAGGSGDGSLNLVNSEISFSVADCCGGGCCCCC